MLGILLVGLIWGLTNKLMESGAKQVKPWCSFLPVHLQEFLHYRVLFPFIINQLGSLLYYYSLGNTPIKIAVPIANSVSFITTMLLDSQTLKAITGASLVIIGISLCLNG